MKINYVIAKPWVEGQPQLCIYAYGTEVFFGTVKQAKEMRDFIRGREKDDAYQVYPIDMNFIK